MGNGHLREKIPIFEAIPCEDYLCFRIIAILLRGKNLSVRLKIIEILSENPGTVVSGKYLGEVLGISRSAVWRHIKVLRKEGYLIHSRTNSGYSIAAAPDILTDAGITGYLTTKRIGRKLDVYKSIDSTNSFAKNLAILGSPDGKTIIADTQTGGRGRFDRVYYSPAGNGIYMSVIIRPHFNVDRSLLITSAAAVAVTDALLSLSGLETRIKWVNDILSDQNGGVPRKLCGILAEASMGLETSGLDYAVIGIGINVNNTSFPPDLRKTATSVYIETKQYYSRNQLAAEILNNLEKRIDSIETGGFMDDYRTRSIVIGKRIRVTNGNSVYKSTVSGIDEYGRLILTDEDGQTSTLSSGSISLID
jgi:BirA family biotin operon repressor/biotin-[acetyl-CoA-carboxylase] ligase